MAHYDKPHDTTDPWDTFLEEVSDTAQEQQEVRRRVQDATTRLWDEIDQEGVPHIFSPDPDEQDRRTQEAIAQITQSLQADSEIDAALAREKALEQVYAQMSNEIAMAGHILIAQGFIEDTPDESIRERDKKRLIAQLMVRQGAFRDPWVTFANKIVPGELFDITNPSDAIYVLEEQMKEDIAADQRRKNEETYAHAMELAGIADIDDAVQQAALTLAISQLMTTAAIRRPVGNAEAERQAQFDEIIRDSPLDPATAKHIVELLEKAYPL